MSTEDIGNLMIPFWVLNKFLSHLTIQPKNTKSNLKMHSKYLNIPFGRQATSLARTKVVKPLTE